MSIQVAASSTQSEERPEYSALDLLHKASNDLPKYQLWIATLFANNQPDGEKIDVLDFGCGTGVLSKNYFALTATRPVGIEIDGRLHCCSESQGYEIFHTLKEVDRKFDYIFSSNVLEHIEDDVKVLRELKGALRLNGRLALFLPAFSLLWSRMDERVGHFRRYNIDSLCGKLVQQGYVVEQCRYYDSAGFFLSLIYRFMPGADGNPSQRSLQFFDNIVFPISRCLDRVCGKYFGKNIFVLARPMN